MDLAAMGCGNGLPTKLNLSRNCIGEHVAQQLVEMCEAAIAENVKRANGRICGGALRGAQRLPPPTSPQLPSNCGDIGGGRVPGP